MPEKMSATKYYDRQMPNRGRLYPYPPAGGCKKKRVRAPYLYLLCLQARGGVPTVRQEAGSSTVFL